MLILIYNAINKWRKTILIRKPYKTNKNISRLFYILMMIIFVWFIGIQILGPDEQFLTNLDIPSSTMVLLHGRNPMAQNKTFLFLDVIKFQQNRRWSLLLHFQMIITRMWSRSVLPFKMYVFTLMENFEKSTMQKVCTDLAKTLPAVIYSAILRLQMPERNFVWNLQHIRVTTLVLSIRFTVEIKCRSGVIFSIITSLEPWSDHLSFCIDCHNLIQYRPWNCLQNQV